MDNKSTRGGGSQSGGTRLDDAGATENKEAQPDPAHETGDDLSQLIMALTIQKIKVCICRRRALFTQTHFLVLPKAMKKGEPTIAEEVIQS